MPPYDVVRFDGVEWENLSTGTPNPGGGGDPGPPPVAWSDSNPPWAYTSTAEFTQDWPGGMVEVPLRTDAADFYTNLSNTIAGAGQRAIVRCDTATPHVHQLKSFRLIGSSGDPKYAFGWWFANLRGWLGHGPDKCVIQMDPDAVSPSQIASIQQMGSGDLSAPLQMGFARVDGSPTSPVYIAGVTLRAADQPNLTALSNANLAASITLPTPCPHQGLVLYPGGAGMLSHVRFQGAGRALSGIPPFEMANVTSQRGAYKFRKVEFDGRRAVELDPARPRRCAPIMGNNETTHVLEDCWGGWSPVSRYAVNDSNQNTSGTYDVIRTQVERITDAQNTGVLFSTPPACLGYESVNGTINVVDSVLIVDNPAPKGGVYQYHISLTSVGRNPQGGRMYVRGTWFLNRAFPALNGFLTLRVSTGTYWWTDGLANTVFVYHPTSGARLTAYTYSGTWPPSVSALAASGVTPATHYLVRTAA